MYVCVFFEDEIWSSYLLSTHLCLLNLVIWSLKLIRVLGLSGVFCIHARCEVLYFQLGLPVMLCSALLSPTESIAYKQMITQKKKNLFQNFKIGNQSVSVQL